MFRFGERVYRRLLRIYPREFRDHFGSEMLRLYRDRAHTERSLTLWLSILADLIRTVPAEWCNMLMHDLRHAARFLWRTPLLTASAVLTLALGIGANTAIFSVIDAVLLSPLPFPDPDRLVQVWTRFTDVGLPRNENDVSPPELRDITELGRSFSQIAAYSGTTFNLSMAGQPARLQGALVSPVLLEMIGVRPAVGRPFSSADSQPGQGRVVLISHGLWRDRFGTDSGIVGQTLRLNGQSYVVVGVLPEAFEFPDRMRVDVLAPLTLGAPDYELPTSRGNHWLRVIARLAPGVSLEQAHADMAAVSQRMIEANRGYPYEKYNFGIIITPLLEQSVRDSRLIMWLLMGAVTLVLLVACINIANLLLVRASARKAEMAIRCALGASRTRLVRQMVTESLLLAACGGVAGLLFTAWGMRGLVHMAQELPRVQNAALNLEALAFAAALTLATGVLFGIVPAMQASGDADAQRLRSGSGRSTGDRAVHRLRHALVIAQVALSLVMLLCTGLLTRSLVALLHVDPGFRTGGVLTMAVSLDSRYQEPERRQAFIEQVLTSARALPEVEAAGAVSALPLRGSASGTVTLDSRGQSSTADVDLLSVTPGYFDALRIHLVGGRPFDAHDGPNSAPVAIVDEVLAKSLWPNENPVGKRLKRGFPDSSEPWMTVVGVVGHVRQETLEKPSRTQVYWPYAQRPSTAATLVIRSRSDSNTLAGQLRKLVTAADSEQPVYDVRSMDGVMSDVLARRRIALTLLAVLSVLALILASVGLYGVLAYAVSQRIHEFGIRAALGASPTRILRDVTAHGMTLAALGCGLGLAASLPLSRTVQGLLYGVDPLDPLTFTVVLLVLLGVGLLAAYIPARRAARSDPAIALRYE